MGQAMSASWKITAHGPKPLIQAALLAHDEAFGWDEEVVLSGREEAEDRPDDWVLEAWLSRKPGKADMDMVAALFADGAPELAAEKLPDEDWITLSQQGVEPIRAGRFFIHTPISSRAMRRACAPSPSPPARPSAPASMRPQQAASPC